MRFLALLLAVAAFAAQAQSFPTRPVRLMVGSAAGGGTDIISRLLAAKLQEFWGQPVVVENRTGASASIAADFAAITKSQPSAKLAPAPAATPLTIAITGTGIDAMRSASGL